MSRKHTPNTLSNSAIFAILSGAAVAIIFGVLFVNLYLSNLPN